MNTQEALLRAVITDPADDLPRLAFADWLEENGQDARAEFIRVQAELAKVPPCWAERISGAGGQHPGHGCRYCDLRSRERDLWQSDAVSLGGLGFDFWAGVGVTPGLDWFSRGFVSRVSAPLQAWWEHGRQIVRSHPVEALELSDRVPLSVGENPYPFLLSAVPDVSGPHPRGMHVLPASIFRLLPGEARKRGGRLNPRFALFPDESSARLAANAAALAWARS